MNTQDISLSLSWKRTADRTASTTGTFCLSLLVLFFSIGGCAGPKREVTYNQGEYQQVLDRQKSGLAPSDDQISNASKDLSAHELHRLGDLYLQQGNPSLAIVQYQKAVEADPSLFRIHYKIGDMFLKKGLPQDALQHFQEVLKRDDHDALAIEGVGEAYFRMGKEEEADASFRNAITLQPDRWQTRNLLGMLLDRQKRHQDALAEYEQGLRVRPDEATLLNNAGLAYYLLGRYEEATQSFQRALRTGSGQPKIHNNLGLALAKLRRYHDALESFRSGSSEEEAYNNLGVFYLSNDEARQAVACFKKAIELSPRYYDKANDNLTLATRALEKHKKTNQDIAGVKPSTCPS
ncbi:MAG: tetratricopeptide repeat protein [Nitrospirota bacterium]|nr:tetratricopeptide repeat protein [Nitrospirota bacterium]